MMQLDYFLYMAEAEGVDSVVNTRIARINAAKREFENRLRRGYTDVTQEFYNSIYAHNLTDADIDLYTAQEFQSIADKY